MASDDKKTKTPSAPKKEAPAAEKTVAAPAPAKTAEAAPAKSTDAAPAKAGATTPAKADGGDNAAAAPASYSRGEGQKAVTQAYKDNWNAIFAKKKTKTKKR